MQSRTKYISCIEQDGTNIRTLTLTVYVSDPAIDPELIIKQAVTDYLKTPEGHKQYEQNNDCFNWANLKACLPEEFCVSYGFLIHNCIICEKVHDWNENLINPQLLPENHPNDHS